MNVKKQAPVETGKVLTGTIVSTKVKGTVQVKVERLFTHAIYKKPVKRTNTIAVHSTDETLVVGDLVKIISTRPISKTKHFKVVEKITL